MYSILIKIYNQHRECETREEVFGENRRQAVLRARKFLKSCEIDPSEIKDRSGNYWEYYEPRNPLIWGEEMVADLLKNKKATI